MKLTKNNQSGLGHFVLIVVVLGVAGLIAFAALRVMDSNQQKKDDQSDKSTVQTTPKVTNGEAPIKDSGDLDQVNSSLEKTNLDNDLNAESFDEDVNGTL